MIRKEVKDFCLRHVFDCGQCFRWNQEEDGSYTGTAMGRTVNLRLLPPENGSPQYLEIEGTDETEFETVWRPYLDLDRDYAGIKQTLAKEDPIMAEAILAGSGIRLLRQEPWETLISFLISQNNNIPRIKKCIEMLSSRFGEELPEFRGAKRFAFPTVETLAALTPEALAEIRLGYRARYIIETARAVAQDGGQMLRSLPGRSAEEAYAYLTGLCGVGPKVANCILLFSMEKYDRFPVDVWVRRVMEELYHLEEKETGGIEAFAAEHFGEYGGFAQQYLFYYMREKNKKNVLTLSGKRVQ